MATLTLTDWAILFGLATLAGLSYYWRVSKKRKINVAIEAGMVGVVVLLVSLFVKNMV